MSKVILILTDGMRPDALLQCGNPYVAELLAHSAHDLAAKTVMPSVTLPCHMSLFHSVTPQRHGILTNTYVPQVRPVKGLFEVLRAANKRCAMFYNWEELKDISRPDSLAFSTFVSGHLYGYEDANARLTDACIAHVVKDAPDFVFLYLGWADEAGHANGWMSDEYLRAVSESVSSIRRVIASVPEDYTVICTADHGGHDYCHGTELAEDVTIPVLFYDRKEARDLSGVSILDVAPTVASLLGVEADTDWKGTALSF